MTSLISDLQPSNQPVLSNKPLNNLQSGISLQRAAVVISTSSANSSNCPCTTLKNQTYINQDFTNTAFINLTMISGGFTACDLTLTNFTKSVLASYSFLRCTGYSPMFYQVTLSDASFVGCTMTNASWGGATLQKVSCSGTIFGSDGQNNADFSDATLDHFETDSTTKFDFCTFTRVALKGFYVEGSSMQNCEFGHSKFDNAGFSAVNLNNSSFHHATLSRVSFANGTTLSGVYFLSTVMDYVELSNMNLNGVIFDNSRLSNIDASGSSLIAASFLGANVSNSDFTNAALSTTANPMNNNAKVATNFQNSVLTRITVSGSANMRFTVFTGATISLSQFSGISPLQPLDAREADFSDAVVMDCSFQFCNFSNTNFDNSIMTRVNFVGCSLLNARIENVQLEYCTADVLTILPRNWQRDRNGWIYVYDAGPVHPEQARNQILTLGIYNNIFQSVVINGYESNSVYDVQLLDGTYVTARRIRKMNQVPQPAGSYLVGSPVFVQIASNRYVHGIINSANIGTTNYKIDFYSDVSSANIPTTQDQSNLFLEYFEYGKVISVGVPPPNSILIDNPNAYILYRAIQTVTSPATVTWFNGLQDDNVAPIRRLSLVQPLACTLDQTVFVLIQENSNGDNYYTSGTIVDVKPDNMYDVSVAGNGNATVSIQNIYLETLYSM